MKYPKNFLVFSHFSLSRTRIINSFNIEAFIIMTLYLYYKCAVYFHFILNHIYYVKGSHIVMIVFATNLQKVDFIIEQKSWSMSLTYLKEFIKLNTLQSCRKLTLEKYYEKKYAIWLRGNTWASFKSFDIIWIIWKKLRFFVIELIIL